MAMLKVQSWRPDTHPGHVIETEWEYDIEAGRDTGREHRGVSVRYPDGTYIHRDTDGADVTQEHYARLLAEHVIKKSGLWIDCRGFAGAHEETRAGQRRRSGSGRSRATATDSEGKAQAAICPPWKRPL